MYGLIKQEHLVDIVEEVCICLGHGSNHNATSLLLETAGAETLKGQIKDPTEEAGMGITQFDRIPFQDVKDRVKVSDKGKIIEYFDIDIDMVEWYDLRYNPLLAMIFTRLKYKKIPDIIPATVGLRSLYWKKYYNTEAGKGTPEHYIKANLY